MLLHRQFSDRDLKETIQEKLIINLGGFVTEVGQLEFLLNTEKTIHNLKGKKRIYIKTYFISFFLPNFRLAWEKQKDQSFPNWWLSHSTALLFWAALDRNWIALTTLLGGWEPLPGVLEPPTRSKKWSDFLSLTKLFTNQLTQRIQTCVQLKFSAKGGWTWGHFHPLRCLPAGAQQPPGTLRNVEVLLPNKQQVTENLFDWGLSGISPATHSTVTAKTDSPEGLQLSTHLTYENTNSSKFHL